MSCVVSVFICDDDGLLAEQLAAQVEACFQARGIAPSVRICNSGAELRALLPECKPDLIFLDLSLKDEDGYRLAEEIRAQRLRAEIVFVTSHPERMPAAFSYRPIGFIAKPADAKDIDAAVNRFLLFYWNMETSYCICTREQSVQVPLRDILYFESSGHRVFIHLENRPEPLSQTRRLDEIAAELEDRAFLRIHKSFLVRADTISHIDRSNLRAMLKNGTGLPISRRYYSQVLEQFIHYQLR